MAKVNNKTKGFGSIPRDVVYDNELSDRARFVYVYMACKPENWEFYQDNVAEELGYGKDTLRKYLDELIIRGWITENEQQNDGKFGCLEYIIEVKRKVGNLPIRKKPDTEKTRIGKNTNQRNIDSISSDNNLSSDNNKEIKKEKKRLSNDNQKELDPLFEKFYEEYGYNKNRQRAVSAWKKLSKQDKESAIAAIPVYKEDCLRNDRQMKHPATYLNSRTWEDDFENNGRLSKKEEKEESDTTYPDGMTKEKWTDITLWLCNNCRKIAGKISPNDFAEMKERCKGDSKLLSQILIDINDFVEQSGQADVKGKFEEYLTKNLSHE